MIRLSILTRMMGEFQLYGDHVQKNGVCARNKGVLITLRMLLIMVRLTICPAGILTAGAIVLLVIMSVATPTHEG